MTPSDRKLNAAVRQAHDAVNLAIRSDIDRMRFKIEKFGRHRDGYLHARVLVDGDRAVYFSLRYGSWLAPGQNGKLKEPEALLGSELGRTVKFALSHAAKRFHPTPQEEDEDAPAETAPSAGLDGQTEPTAGVPAGGDRGDAG